MWPRAQKIGRDRFPEFGQERDRGRFGFLVGEIEDQLVVRFSLKCSLVFAPVMDGEGHGQEWAQGAEAHDSRR